MSITTFTRRSTLRTTIAALGAVFAFNAFAQNLPELKVGINPAFEPYGMKLPDGTLIGFDVDYAKAICNGIKMKCVFLNKLGVALFQHSQRKNLMSLFHQCLSLKRVN